MRATKIVACAAAMGNLLNGWDSATLAGALLYIEPEFDLDTQPVLEGFVAAASLVGAALSTTFAGSGADWLGRRKMICISAIVYCLGALLMFWSPNVYMLLVARVLDGVGVGLAVTVGPLYISEVSPAEIRGELNTLPQLLGTTGMFLAYCMVFGLSLTSNPSWRMMLGFLFIPSLIYLALGLFFLPESPRWLVSKGRTKEAKQVLQRLRSKEDVSGEMALLVEGLGVGEAPTLEEYIIQPADFMGDLDNAIASEEDNHIKLFTPEDGTAWIAKPISSVTGSQGFLSRPSSIIHQATPRLGSMSLMDPMVTLMGSFKGTFAEHYHGFGSMYSHAHNQQFEAFADEKDDEESTRRHNEVSGYYSEDGDGEGALTSPLLSRHSSGHWEESDLRRADSLASSVSRIASKDVKEVSHQAVPTSIAPQHGSFVGSVGSTGIGGGWQLAWQWTGPEGTEGKPDQGTYQRIFLFQEAPVDGPRMGSTYSLPRFGSTVGEVESIPAAALISRPSQYGKDIHLENQVGPALVHPAETATKGPAWSDLFEGGVKQALIVGVVLQILEQFGGINAVLNFTPEILQESGADVLLSQMGISSDSASILASAATQLVALPFIVIAMRLMDIVGRRKILLTTLPILVIALLCLIIINLVPTSDAVFATVSVLSVVVYVIFFVTGNLPSSYVDNKYLETKGMPLEVIVEFFAMSAAEKKKPAVDYDEFGKEGEV
ncbi:hypothetical protein GOP47_0027756 [Adiantum capillus-veneris]|nr:hypothetical protein GOP47_0027756 [Adiantum capillus-veneris]